MDTQDTNDTGEMKEGGLSKKHIAVIVLLVLILAGGIAYFAVKLKQKEAGAIEQFEIPARTLQQIVEIEGRMQALEAEQLPKMEEEREGLRQAAEAAAEQAQKIKDETAKRSPVAPPVSTLPGGAFDFNPR